MNDEKILILGAGPAGMAAAVQLSKNRKESIIVEKNLEVGGLARTFFYGNFRTDVGPHRFFSKNKFLYDFIEELLGKKWIKVKRITRFYIKEKFFLYPVNLKNAVLNVGVFHAFRIILDYLIEKIKKIFRKKQSVSFEEQIVSDFGRSLAELNMLNYTEKIWGIPCSKISPDWATQRIQGLSIKEVIKKALKKTGVGPKSMVEQFYYPEEGNYLIYEKMRKKAGKNAVFKMNSAVSKITHKNSIISKVEIISNGKKQEIEVNNEIISSIPITLFIRLLEPKAPKSIVGEVKKLKFRSHVSLFITLNKSSVFKDQWIYFPEKEIPFARIMEPKNFSKKMSPENKTSILLEFFCWENDKIWNANKEELFKLAVPWLEKLGFINKKEVINYFVHKEKNAYPVYDLNYNRPLNKIINYLNQFENLQVIGRGGRFKYNNQDHALEMGFIAARNIIERKKHSFEYIGTEQEYFEKGYVK